MIIYLSLLVAVIGGLAYLISANEKYQRLGLVAFGCGLHAFLFTGVSHLLTVVK